jgi:tRNA threonylcarbamoyladenosine biosynthesis protein TsaB
MLVLALDTALDRTAVALTDGKRVAVARVEVMDRGHAERLLPMVEAVMTEAALPLSAIDRIVVTIGPGSFTGIRIALAAARGIALAIGRPVVGIDTLTALAASLGEPAGGAILAAIDARRGEIYAALLTPDGGMIEPPFVADAAGVLARIDGRAAVIVGSGAPILAHQAAIEGRSVPPLRPLPGPDPLAVARLGAAAPLPARAPGPLYLRQPDAKPQAPRATFRETGRTP